MPNNLNAGPTKNLNGPSGRVRNTSTSNAARVPGVPNGLKPPTIPGAGASYSSVPGMTSSAATAWAALQNQMAASRAQRLGLKAALKSTKAGIRSEAVANMSAAINDGIETGMTGSSNVSEARIGVLGQRRADIEGAITDTRQQMLASKAQDQQAYMGYAIQQQEMEMQAAAMRQSAALQQQAIDAAASSNSDLIAAIRGMGTGGSAGISTVKYQGQAFDVTPLKNGRVLVGAETFKADDAAAIRKYLADVVGRQQLTVNRYNVGRMG